MLFVDPPETKLWVMGSGNEMKLSGSHDVWQSPHFHCFTWRAGGSFKVNTSPFNYKG